MTYGEAVKDRRTKLGRLAAETKADRKRALARLMAQGLSLEEAAMAWANDVARGRA